MCEVFFCLFLGIVRMGEEFESHPRHKDEKQVESWIYDRVEKWLLVKCPIPSFPKNTKADHFLPQNMFVV